MSDNESGHARAGHAPALKVGGVRQSSNFKKTREEDKNESDSATAVTNVTNALQPTPTVEQLLVAPVEKAPSIADAEQKPKAIASTYYPPQPKHENQGGHHANIQADVRKGSRGHIQQPGGAYGVKK